MIYSVVGTLFTIYNFMIIVYILMSWFPGARDSQIGEILGKAVEPYLGIFRKFIPPIGGMLDISPIVALIALRFIQSGVYFLLDAIGLI